MDECRIKRYTECGNGRYYKPSHCRTFFDNEIKPIPTFYDESEEFSKTTKQQELGVAVHAPAKSGIWLILDATSKKAKRKAPYFKRSTVLFWWRIAGSNR